MPHDPARVADTRAWLTRARDDLRAAEHDGTSVARDVLIAITTRLPAETR